MSDENGRIIDLHQQREAASMTRLLGRLARSNDRVLATAHNAMLILEEDPALRGCFAYDAFRYEPLLMRSPPPPDDGMASLPGPYPRAWQLADIIIVQCYLQRFYSHRFNRGTVEDAIVQVAERHPFHRPREWLDGLRWDGVERLDKWLHHACGTPDDDYHRQTGAKFLIACVRRIRQPGCKFDSMPILEGPQGIGKSELCRILAGDAYFSDSMPSQLESKEAALALHGHIIVELAEIQQIVRNEPEIVKAYLSRAIDRYRPPYGRTYKEFPRQGVLVGTTNVYDYLRDPTGNRRFWPWRCRFIKRNWLLDNREQLWAEAAHREAAGEQIWISDVAILEQSEREQANRLEEDTWAEAVHLYLLDKSIKEVSASNVLVLALGVPLERQDLRQKRRVTAVLRRLGWEQAPLASEGGARIRMWRRGSNAATAAKPAAKR